MTCSLLICMVGVGCVRMTTVPHHTFHGLIDTMGVKLRNTPILFLRNLYAMDTHDEMNAVSNMLTISSEFDLRNEVVWSALKAMKADPSITIDDACNAGLTEWDL